MISLRNILLLMLMVQLSSAASSSSSRIVSASASSTCPSRTVNYITHGLPQQCLASTRPAMVNTTASVSSLGSNVTFHNYSNASTGQTSLTGSRSTETSEQMAVEPSSTRSLLATMEATEDVDMMPQADLTTLSSTTTILPTVFPTAADSSEADSLLDNANFLSFEDWKKQNLLKAGQSEHVGAGRQTGNRDTGRRPNLASQQGLDALGDDAEIDLDFTGFVADRPDLAPPKQPVRLSPGDSSEEFDREPAIPNRPRSKDAGTTCKERYNYASFDCAATVLKTNSRAKGEKFVLLENKDSYMLNECSADHKFLILELCNDISIDTIVLANFEFFSSIFRTFRVSVSDKYPVKIDKWITLGTFEARNSREIQAFLIENPMIWARYVRIEFLTHYGNEFYCPLSLVRVHGTTMMEEYKHDIQSALLAEGGDDNEMERARDDETEESLVPEVVAQVLVEEKSRSAEHEKSVPIPEPLKVTAPTPIIRSIPESQLELTRIKHLSNTTSPSERPEDLFLNLTDVCPKTSITSDAASKSQSVLKQANHFTSETVVTNRPFISLPSAGRSSGTTTAISSPTKNSTSSKKLLVSSTTTPNSTSSLAQDSTRTSTELNNFTTSEKSKASPSTTQSQHASPTIQESFFKSVQKRLQMLESNSSLSLQYIEDQSRALRDAFNRVEQKQLSKTTSFLDYLNATVLNELRDFRQQYDQLWQSTVIELDTQREQYQQEMMAINSRLAILTDELIFQKRISIMQMVLIMICLALVLFSRGSMNSYLDVPIVQSMLAKSSSNKWMSISSLRTPSTSPPQTRPNSSHYATVPSDMLRRHGIQSAVDSEYSPLTPTSTDGRLDAEDHIRSLETGSPIHDAGEIERPRTSPPVLPSTWQSGKSVIIASSDENIDSRILHPLKTDANDSNANMPEFILRPATPPSRHLTFQLPE